MDPLKKLASEAGLYGLPSILGRILNYALVPIHTSIFYEDQFGHISEIYAYVAFLNIIYTYGMETAYFRFTSKHKSAEYYHYFSSAVLLSSAVFSGLIIGFQQPIASFLDIAAEAHIITYVALILFIDAIVALPLAKLRIEHKAKRFATARISAIVLNILFNILFFFGLPSITKNIEGLNGSFSKPFSIGFVYLANLLGNGFMLFYLYKEVFSIRLRVNPEVLKSGLKYSIPILLTGLAWMVVENSEKILFDHLLPDDYYPDKTAEEALGVYSAAFKLSIFMALAVQAFRYAGEPFFFSQAEDKNAPALFARVLYFFVLLSCIIWVGVSLNADLIGQIFLRSEGYREALFLVPVLLLGKLFLGIYINISIWYKLTDKTYYGIYISVTGAVISIIGNFALIPMLGYTGAALVSTFAYFVMCLYAYASGQKYFRVPYPILKISMHLVIAASIIGLYFWLKPDNKWLNYGLGITVTLFYSGILYLLERKNLRNA